MLLLKTLSMLALVFVAVPALAGTLLPPGNYMSTLSPTFDETTAGKFESELSKIGEIQSIDAKPDTSTLHFTVKDNVQVDAGRIADAVKSIVAGTMVTEPIVDID